MTTATPTTPTTSLPRALQRIALARVGFALVWAALLALAPDLPDARVTALLVAYPLVDAAAVLVELRAAATTRASQLANVALSVVAAAALGWASRDSAGTVLTVWGIWAVASGLTQLLTGLGRRRLGGQWPLVASGGLSTVVGLGFVAQGSKDDAALGGVAGYAVAGALFFLVSAVRLRRPARA
jgi:uncharacterized membrane protein HdeD (DUF308 family)